MWATWFGASRGKADQPVFNRDCSCMSNLGLTKPGRRPKASGLAHDHWLDLEHVGWIHIHRDAAPEQRPSAKGPAQSPTQHCGSRWLFLPWYAASIRAGCAGLLCHWHTSSPRTSFSKLFWKFKYFSFLLINLFNTTFKFLYWYSIKIFALLIEYIRFEIQVLKYTKKNN